MNALQKAVEEVFVDAFGITSLRRRLRDINKENIELQRWQDISHLREEAGQLLASVMMLCSECGWEVEDVVSQTLDTIKERRDQYRSYGRKTRVALFGGAFDPITHGHIETAQFVLEVCEDMDEGIDEVWFCPCFQHINNKIMSAADVRVRMCRCAIRNDPRLKVFEYEIQNEFKGDTHNFITRLLAEDFAKNQFTFRFIMGMDRANTAHTWVNWDDLEQKIPFIVVPREGVDPDPKVTWYKYPPHMDLSRCEYEISDTSSSEVRKIIREKQEKAKADRLSELMDSKVMEIIHKLRLYREGYKKV